MKKMIILHTQQDELKFDSRTARLVSFRSSFAPEQEFIAYSEDHPAFIIGYFDEKRAYHHLDSDLAESIHVAQTDSNTIQARYERLAGLDFDVEFTIKTSPDSPFAHFKISLDNQVNLEVMDVHFPIVVCAYDLGGKPDAENLVLPHGYCSGQLLTNFKGEESVSTPIGVFWKRKLKPDNWTTWLWHDWNIEHYPGWQFAQFLAYYNERAGLYLACNDTTGHIKSFKILHREPGFRMGIAHIGDWQQSTNRTLEYDVLLSSFQGDWYDAAEIYRTWSLQQKWATPLTQRDDVPEWLLDSPVYVTIRAQGIVDEGPVFPVEEFIPYEKCIPLLEKVSNRVEAPVVAVFMSWEKAGAWIYPECFPPVGGETSITNFTRMARERGWHVGSFSNGTQWLIGDGWNGYDGQDYFSQHHGETCICRRPDGSGWLSTHYWRPGYPCCMGTPLTRQIAVDYLQHLVNWGFESIQFFDQNCFAVTFACFATDHEHPPLPGTWMNDKMQQLVQEFNAIARQAGEPGVIQSTEAGVNEYCLPLFQEADIRVFPPGYENNVIPLYQYLFHECLVLNGMMSAGQEPYHIEINAAANAALGVIPGGVLRGDGTLNDKDTSNWAPWEPRVGNYDAGIEMLRSVTALRRGPGKNYLVFGRMLRPAQVNGIKTIEWEHEGHKNSIPNVFHSTWQAQNGQIGYFLVNWTHKRARVQLTDEHLPLANQGDITLYVSGKNLHQKNISPADQSITISLPPLSCVLCEI
jgi:hypothetical protein